MAKKKKPTKKGKLKIHLPEMVDVSLITEHPDNSNSQDKATFNTMKESMEEEGFDESIIVAPRTDGKPGYWVVSGNHRFRGGVDLGADALPCVIHDDWNDAIKQRTQLLKRNLVKGQISSSSFTTAVNQLKETTDDTIDSLREKIGMNDPDDFAKRYKEKVAQEEERDATAPIQRDSSVTSKVKLIDDLGAVIQTILAEHGDTVQHSYIFFPTASKTHLMVQSSPSLKKTLEIICERCVRDNLDINVALAGLLSIGMANSDFKKSPDKKKIEKAGKPGKGSGDL